MLHTTARTITRAASKSFLPATLLSRRKRRAIQALYGFLRTTDNIVDDGGLGATLRPSKLARPRSPPRHGAGSPPPRPGPTPATAIASPRHSPTN
ncbi:MAG: squalene/phytoene synthase family protein [Thermomicrobiales bacterium]